MIDIGRVREIVRYPVKSMAGVSTPSAFLGWHGLAGDRRIAIRRMTETSAFPWLTAGRLSKLLLYQPFGFDESSGEPIPTHVRTPEGKELALRSPELQAELSGQFGSAVELMHLKHGIFDDAPVSVISTTTIDTIGRETGTEVDRRRFRANILLETVGDTAFLEDEWVGGTILVGEGDACPAISITMRDLRCAMINLDPDSAQQDPRVMKTVVRLNGNNAGVYGTVVRSGGISTGDRVRLVRGLHATA